MTNDPQITRLQQQVHALSAENVALREGNFRGSKAEALLAFEYDRIPDAMKTPRAVALQRRVATVVIILVPILLVAVAVIGGFNAYRDHQQSVEMQKRLSDFGDTIDRDVRRALPH
ncbi:hypothetical protein [Novosphingobium sp. FSW06-99]|uniref:hypothetical protein n=1 Tax=Novosphingobium sp. FSW06-99 TaxID=1739113 RepID=UPI00076D0B39|nr:hypothetical protein [Novosphingobium sp. FSW06-99]KUR78052.1 hypothetical protein AQZ49_08445 [Novosphingobium sp. FSW06-99]